MCVFNCLFEILFDFHLILTLSLSPSLSFLSCSTARPDKLFLYEVVANARNSVDVDKFDYISRDCLNLGMATNFKNERLIKNARVINNEICFNAKESYNL